MPKFGLPKSGREEPGIPLRALRLIKKTSAGLALSSAPKRRNDVAWG